MVFKTWLTGLNDVQKAINNISTLSTTANGATHLFSNSAVVQQYASALNGLNKEQVLLALSYKNLSTQQKEQILAQMGLIASENTIQSELLQTTLAQKGVSAEKSKAILVELGLMNAETGEVLSQKACTKADLEAILAQKGITGAQAEGIISALGLGGANAGLTASFELLRKAILGATTALLSNPMTWVVAGLAGVATVAYQCSQAIEEVEAKAQELNETFITSKTEIEDYKTQIDDLYKVINDSGSSIEDVTTARQNLMAIQDQLIEKFGDEKGAIDLITDAINGQSDALDILTEAQWQAAKNEFNESGFWNNVVNGIDGYSNNIDRMLGEYEGYTVSIDMSEYGGTLFTEGREEFEKMLQDEFGAIQQGSSQTFTLSGDVSEVREKLLEIQEILKENSAYKPDDTFSDYLGGLERSADDVIEKYEDFYKQYVLYEEIFTNDTFTDSYKKINDAYSEYQDAFATGNEESIKKAQDNFANILTQATEGVSDESVADFFNDMYPDLQEEVGTWQFETNFTANTDGLKDNVSEYLSGLDGLYSYDLQNFNYDTATEEQKASYDGLISVARLYGLTIDQLIDKLVLMGLVQDEEYQQLVDKFGKENVAKIAPEDLTYAYQIKNIGDMSFEELQAEIQRLKDEENDPTNIYFSFSSAWNSSDFSDAKKELLELAKSGEITADVLESTEEYNSLLSKTGLTAEEAKDKITNLLTAQEKLAAASNGLDSLSSAFEEFKDIGFVTAQTLESLPDVFKKLGGWDIFSGIVGSGTSTADEVQQAFNDIVKQYLIAQNTFSGLIGASEAEIQSYIANLKQMGVTNAEEVVKQAQIALTEQNNLLAEAEAEAYEGYTRYLENKSEAELAFLEDSGSKNGQLVATLGSAYQQDYQNWQSLLSKKAEAYNAFVNALGGAYNKSLSLAQNIQKNKKQTVVGFNELAAADAAQAQYEEIEYQLKKATQALQLDLSTIDTNFGSSFSPSYSGSSGSSGSGSSSSAKETEESFNWVERVIKKVQRTIDNLSKTVSATYKSWTTRNNALAQQISAINSEFSTQQKAYDYYMKKANSLGLSSAYVNKIKDGTISIETITNESLIDKIKEYQDLYDQACDAQDAIIDLKDEIASLARQRFDNVISEYDSQLAVIEHRANMLEAYLDQTEARGYLASTKYYEALKQAEKENIALLEAEYASLTSQLENSMKTGNIEEGSEEWASMKEEIYGVEEALIEANTALIEYNNSLRELEWEVFDFLQDRISAVTDETQFLIDLMSNKDLYDDKGNLTDEGMATMGLHGQNYNVYMSQADQYAKEIEELNKELEADPNNTALIERREELLELQRESILAAEDEKQAIIDMVEEGINVELEALQKLIDSYNEALDSAKDLYDYQKKVKDLTDEIASLEKQQSAYLGDDSEENKARIQQIKVQLEEARENLEETEYEHYISEQKKLLDELFTEYESILNSRLDNVDALLSDMIDSINANASTIDETLRNESEKVGYTMTDSLQDIWSNEGCASTIISKYGDGFLSQLTSVNNVLNAIAKKIGAMTEESDKQAETNIKNETAKQETKPSSSSTTTKPSTNTTTTTTKTIKVGGKINAGSAKIYDYVGDTSGETQYYKKDPVYTVLGEKSGYLKVRHHSLSSGITGWFKKSDVKAYKTGGLVDETGLAWLDGTKTKPELVLNSKDTENIVGAADTLRNMVTKGILSQLNDFTETYGFNGGLPKIPSSTSIGDVTNQINIAIDRVLDYNDFCNQLREDPQFEKMVQAMTTDQIAGKSKLAKNKFRW